MRNTFNLLPPAKMVQTYLDVGKAGKAASNALWSKYGEKTIRVMQDGTHMLAVLWESAWDVAGGAWGHKVFFTPGASLAYLAAAPHEAINRMSSTRSTPSIVDEHSAL
jgi:hypothetical protein